MVLHGCFLSNRHSQTIATGAHRNPNYRPRHAKRLACEPIAVRSQSSSGNCPAHHHPSKPLPTSHKTCARRSTISHARLDLVIVFSAPLLVAQGWNVSCIGFAPAHGDACLALCATVLCVVCDPGDRDDWCCVQYAAVDGDCSTHFIHNLRGRCHLQRIMVPSHDQAFRRSSG